jgi:HEAT repeat protein
MGVGLGRRQRAHRMWLGPILFFTSIPIQGAEMWGADLSIEEKIAIHLRQLRDKNPRTRCAGATGLVRLEPPRKEFVKLIVELFDDDDEDVRFTAADLLGQMGPVAVPELQSALRSDKPHRRVYAAHALLMTEEWHPTKLDLPPFGEEKKVAYHPDKVSDFAKEAIEVVQACLKDTDAKVRRRAAYTLSDINVYAMPALDALVAAVGDSDPCVRSATRWRTWAGELHRQFPR